MFGLMDCLGSILPSIRVFSNESAFHRTGEAVEKGREESGGNRLAGLQELSHRVTSARRASKEGEQGE